MSEDNELEQVFGEQFAESIEQRVAEKREERNRLTEDQMAEICNLAIKQNKFNPDEGDPIFPFTSSSGMTHDVLLAQVPDPQAGEVWQHLSEPWEGAAKIPLDYLGEWYWSIFPDRKDVADLDQGDWVIVAGSIEEDEGDDGQVYKSIYPVRGIVKLKEAQEYADMAEETEFSSDSSEQDQETVVQEEDSSEEEINDTSDDMFAEESSSSSSSDEPAGMSALLGDDEEEDDDETEEEEPPVSYEPIAASVERMAEAQNDDEEPQVYEIEEGTDHHKRLTSVVINNIPELDSSDSDQVADIVIDVIEEHRQEEEEEEEDETEIQDQLF